MSLISSVARAPGNRETIFCRTQYNGFLCTPRSLSPVCSACAVGIYVNNSSADVAVTPIRSAISTSTPFEKP